MHSHTASTPILPSCSLSQPTSPKSLIDLSDLRRNKENWRRSPRVRKEKRRKNETKRRAGKKEKKTKR
jgi:hypothetical protein